MIHDGQLQHYLPIEIVISKGHQSLLKRASNLQRIKDYWKWVLGLEAEKTFLSCFVAGRKILWGRGNLILLF